MVVVWIILVTVDMITIHFLGTLWDRSNRTPDGLDVECQRGVEADSRVFAQAASRMVWQPTDTRDALVWNRLYRRGRISRIQFWTYWIKMSVWHSYGLSRKLHRIQFTEVRSVSERLCISCIYRIRKPWDCLRLAKGWEYVQKRRRSWTEICGIKGSGRRGGKEAPAEESEWEVASCTTH